MRTLLSRKFMKSVTFCHWVKWVLFLHCWNWHLSIRSFTSFHPKHMKGKFAATICMRFTLFTCAFIFVLHPGNVLAPAAQAPAVQPPVIDHYILRWVCDVFSNSRVRFGLESLLWYSLWTGALLRISLLVSSDSGNARSITVLQKNQQSYYFSDK